MIIDTHAHILDHKFDDDRNMVLLRASDAGISAIIEIACEKGDWKNALSFAKENENVYSVFGVHPLNLDETCDADFEKLECILKNAAKAAALGEIGLDYHYGGAPSKDKQKEYFAKQLDIALRARKPVVIHCREAYKDCVDILKNFSGLKGVIHCFSGDKDSAEKFLSMGFLLGIDGPATYPKSNGLREIISQTDISKILVETDCPYLPPQKYRGQRNEPSYIVETLKAVAAVKRLSYEEAAQITSKNAKELFSI